MDTLKKAYQGRRVLLTGHTGFKGSWLSLWLERLGARTTGLALDPPTAPALFEQAGCADTLESDIRADVRDYAALERAVADTQPEVVFHLAAQPLVRDSYELTRETFEINSGGTVNLLEALRRKAGNLKAVLVVTTDKCYENREWDFAYREADPLGGSDPYSASKAAAEIVCASYRRSFFAPSGIALATARAGNVIGGGDWARDRIVPDAVAALSAGKPLRLRLPAAIRPWQHVLEPLYGYLILGARLLSAAESGDSRELAALCGAFNFAPETTSCRPVAELAALFCREFGGEAAASRIEIDPAGDSGRHEAGLLMLAWDKAFRTLGWSPRWSFERAVERSAAWYAGAARGEDCRTLCLKDIADYIGTVV